MKQGESGQSEIYIEASPDQVYGVVTDVARMGEWSPECRECHWVDGASGPQVGAKFKGSNKRGVARWSTTPEVVVAEPGSEFAFATETRGKPLTRWSYRMAPEGTGTRVTESFEMLSDEPPMIDFMMRWFMRIKDRRSDLEQGMAQTLAKIKLAVESS